MVYRALFAVAAVSLAVTSFAADADARKRYRNYGAYGYEGYYPGPQYVPPPPRYYYDPFYDPYYDPYYDPPIRKVKPAKKKAAKDRSVVSKKTVKTKSVATKEPAPLVLAPKKALPSAPKKTLSLDTPAKSSPSIPVKSNNAVSCDKATSILSGYGFSGIKASDCTGQVYAFDAARDGKTYAIKLNATSGELTEVRKVR